MKRDWILETVDSLYAAAMGEIAWDPVLTSIAEELNADGATMEIHRVDNKQVARIESIRLDMSNAMRYARDYSHNPRNAYLHTFRNGVIGHDHLLIDEPEMDRDPFYQELLAPSGLRYFISAQTPILDDNFVAFLAFQLRARDGAAGDKHFTVMRLLEPHIKRALSLAWIGQRDQVDPERFARQLTSLGLTAAESQLAKCLALGEALPDYARRNGRSTNTVHTHYRRIKDKLDCANQTELLARLHALKSS